METGNLYKYKVSSFQGLLQILVENLFGRGYYFYCLIQLPAHKCNKWEQIDAKLIEKYKANKSKHQRHRAKVKGVANFFYLRYGAVALILHTMGDIPEGIKYEDLFYDIRKKPLLLEISETLAFEIYSEKKAGQKNNYKINVKLAQRLYYFNKAKFAELAERRDHDRLKREFKKLNGYPAYAAIIKQKKELARFIINQAGKHQFLLKQKDLILNTKRKIYNVWETDKCGEEV